MHTERIPCAAVTSGRVLAVGVVAALAGAGVAASAARADCGGPKNARPVHHAGRRGRPPLVIGDSTLIFAAPVLGRLGIEAQAQGCRQFGQGIAILAARRHAHTLPAVAVLALGANGPIGAGQIAQALAIMGPRRVLGLVTPRNSATSAAQMRRAARRHPDRVLLIDWVAFSAGHGGWFAGDGLHVGYDGASAYAHLIERRIAPYAFPPVRALDLPRTARDAKPCGVVHRGGHALTVYVVRGRSRARCARARALVRRPPLRPAPGWRTYDWRRAGDGPWAWVYARADRRVVVAAIPGHSRAAAA